jgi:Ca2+-binding RTX toxin-like protein
MENIISQQQGKLSPNDNFLASLPLISQSDLTYLGGFEVPTTDGTGDSEEDSFTYGGQALGYNPVNDSLFFGGHPYHSLLAEISIPEATLDFAETAEVLQPLTDVTEGTLSQVDPTDDTGIFLGGNLVYKGRLITSAYTYYDADGTQAVSHGVSSNLNLSDTDNFDGWYGFDAVANPRSLAGYMGLIPPEWQSVLGGPALTGQGGLSILSTNSFGPALTVFDPDDVGTQNPIPGTTVTFYPEDNLLPAAQFNWATNFSGIAFPPGTRSVLVFGRHGENFCYGGGEECNDPCNPYQGAHAYPYHFQVWAYDALDFLDVINGTQEPWEVQPYAFWTLTDIDNSGCAAVNFGGGTYDPATGRFFITEEFGEEPAVHVYQIKVFNVPTTGNDILVGTVKADLINGLAGNDEIFGLAGNDRLIGGKGSDVLTGGKGRDILTGGKGKDEFVLLNNSGADRINDFEDGVDLLELTGKLSFGKLTIVDADNGTKIFRGKQLLATLVGIDDSTVITSEDFI